VRGLSAVADPKAEALRLGCTHVFLDGSVHAIGDATTKSKKS
jgi:hypothetical protein